MSQRKRPGPSREWRTITGTKFKHPAHLFVHEDGSIGRIGGMACGEYLRGVPTDPAPATLRRCPQCRRIERRLIRTDWQYQYLRLRRWVRRVQRPLAEYVESVATCGDEQEEVRLCRRASADLSLALMGADTPSRRLRLEDI